MFHDFKTIEILIHVYLLVVSHTNIVFYILLVARMSTYMFAYFVFIYFYLGNLNVDLRGQFLFHFNHDRGG